MSALRELFDTPIVGDTWLGDARSSKFGQHTAERRALIAITRAVREHKDDWDDWFAAFMLALEKTKDVHEAVAAANEATAQRSVQESREEKQEWTGYVVKGDRVQFIRNGQIEAEGRLDRMRIDHSLPIQYE